MAVKISTINLCLGLKNKKLLIKKMLEENEDFKRSDPLIVAGGLIKYIQD